MVPQLITGGTKILSICLENRPFFAPLIVYEFKDIAQILWPQCKKGYYAHFFNTANNLAYVGPYTEPKYYGADII